MRVSISATGSVTGMFNPPFLLPTCLFYTGNLTTVSKLSKANTANAILSQNRMRTTANTASGVSSSRKLGNALLF
jgi:hypothetical protein